MLRFMVLGPDQRAHADQLHEQLQLLLDNLNQELARKEFPSPEELRAIEDAIMELATTLGRKRKALVHRWGVIKQLDHDYSKLGLAIIFGKLLAEVLAVPQGPVTKIAKHLETFPTADDAELLKTLMARITNNDWHPDNSDIKGKDVLDALEPFASPSFDKALRSVTKQLAGKTPEQQELFYDILGMIAFADVQSRYWQWKANYEAHVIPVVHWLYHWMNPEWNAKLQERFCSKALTLAQFKARHKRTLDAKRQKKRRNRKKADKNLPQLA